MIDPIADMMANQTIHQVGQLSETAFLVSSIVKVLVIFLVVLVTVAMLTLLERKVSAWMQDRLGPNRVGPGGLLQPAADGLKNILKEETSPAQANAAFFRLAPMLSITPAMVSSSPILPIELWKACAWPWNWPSTVVGMLISSRAWLMAVTASDRL